MSKIVKKTLLLGKFDIEWTKNEFGGYDGEFPHAPSAGRVVVGGYPDVYGHCSYSWHLGFTINDGYPMVIIVEGWACYDTPEECIKNFERWYAGNHEVRQISRFQYEVWNEEYWSLDVDSPV